VLALARQHCVGVPQVLSRRRSRASLLRSCYANKKAPVSRGLGVEAPGVEPLQGNRANPRNRGDLASKRPKLLQEFAPSCAAVGHGFRTLGHGFRALGHGAGA